MPVQKSLLSEILKENGYSHTSVRQKIFESLQDKEPITLQAIVSINPTIDRSSIYRTIDLFEKLGIVQRFQFGWKYKIELTDQFNHHHHHIMCIICERVDSFSEPESIEQAVKDVATQLGYRPSSHQLEVSGICAECRN